MLLPIFLTEDQTFTPRAIPNCLLWVEASDSSTIVLQPATSQVAQWTDKSGQNNHLTQGTSANQPLIVSNALGGRSAIRFDGINDFFNHNNISLTESTAFFVTSPSGSGTRAFMGGIINSLVLRIDTQLQLLKSNVFGFPKATTTITNSKQLVGYDINSGTYNYYRNNANDGTGSHIQTFVANNKIGVDFNASYFNGDIAEIVIFNRVLTSQERTLISNWLNAKYNLY